MLRQPELDAPGVLSRLPRMMARGIDRGQIFVDGDDREDFVNRLGALASSEAVRLSKSWV